MQKKPAEPAPVDFWESPLEPVYHNIRKNLKGYPHANFIEIYLGLSVIIFFLLVTSLAPQIGEKLGLISQRKEGQQSFAKPNDQAEQEKGKDANKEPKKEAAASASDANLSHQMPIQQFTLPAVIEKAKGKVTGRVIAAEGGKPVSGAEVIIKNKYFEIKTTTDASGNYQFNEIRSGKYLVEVVKDGFVIQKIPVIVPIEETAVNADISLL